MPSRAGQENIDKESGSEPFTRRPAFGGRGLTRSIPTAEELRAKVFAKSGTVVIGAKNMNPTKQNRSYWKLGEKDMTSFNALFTEYGELEPQYNACSPTQRTEWINQITCCKALFCLNAIYRTQGILDSRVEKIDPDRGTSDWPLQSEVMPSGLGTKLVLDRLDTKTDIMYGWWFDECPNLKRSPEIMKAVEFVKSIIKEAFEFRSLCEGHEASPGMQSILLSLQSTAVIAVQEFDRRWTQEFPIMVDAVLIAMAPIQDFLFASMQAVVDQPHPEEESSGQKSDQAKKQSSLPKKRSVPPVKASVTTSSRKRSDTSKQLQRTARSMDVDVPLPRTRKASLAGGKPRR